MNGSGTVVLVHGAWGSPEMWDHVIEALPATAEVLVADLPTCREPGATLFDDAEHVCRLVGDRPAVLVGHSYGGAVITEAGARMPSLERLVYVAAAMPAVGESMFDWLMKRPLDGMPMQFRDDGTAVLDVEGVDLPYDDVTLERLGRVRLRPFALAAVTTPLGACAWTTVPSTYLVATQDTTIHPDTQREMAGRAGSVIEVDTEHQMILSRPEAVAAAILDLG